MHIILYDKYIIRYCRTPASVLVVSGKAHMEHGAAGRAGGAEHLNR